MTADQFVENALQIDSLASSSSDEFLLREFRTLCADWREHQQELAGLDLEDDGCAGGACKL